MSSPPPTRSALARWLGWALFWYGVYWAGTEVQTWVFDKESAPKPAAADLLEPLHFWAPAVFFFSPVWPLQRFAEGLAPAGGIGLLRAATAAWSITIAGLIVWVEDTLRPDASHHIGTYVLIGVTGLLVAMRLAALLPTDESARFVISSASFLLLGGLVLVTWVSLLIGLATIGVRRLARRRRN